MLGNIFIYICKFLLITTGLKGYKFSELLNLVIEMKLYDTAYRNKKGRCQCPFKCKDKEWIAKWVELSDHLKRAFTKSDMSKE